MTALTAAIRKRNVEPQPALNETPTAQPNSKEKGGRSISASPVRQPIQPKDRWTSGAGRALMILTLISFVLRFALINEPAEVVFDEVHFGGFASQYLRREYFFDVHPPLGKLLIAGVGYLFGYDGSFTFGTIGLSYANSSAPYVAMRMFMVLLNCASIAMSFATLIEMGSSTLAATLCSGLLAFDNALVIQSRFILLDSILLFFISAAIYCWVKFRQQRAQPFKSRWWMWLVLSGIAIGGATSVKMVGLFTVAAIGIVTIIDLWELADWKRRLSDRTVAKHFFTRAAGLIAVPLFVYLASYWVHFKVLNRTGSGDLFMSPDFQAGLEGNQMHSNSREIYYGHTIRIKSRLEEIYLHSHNHTYPRIHDDGKVSSQGQQVTGYPAKDRNNLWKILPAERKRISHEEKMVIKDGDSIRLMHVGTGKMLYTHDVASPLTRTNMEITVVDEEDEEKFAATLWNVEIKAGGQVLKALSCQFRLVHNVHKVALTNHQQPLPKWGFGQREINGDKRGLDENSKWIVWDVDEPMSESEKKAMAKKPKPRLSFLEKFVELQKAQIKHNAALIDNHPFKSDPITWPFVTRGVSYWDKNSMGRIYLLGNPIAWYICLFGLMAFAVVASRQLYRQRRGKDPRLGVENHYEARFLPRVGFLALAWATHYFPFFTMARTLYLHHYLPAYTISAMVTGAIIDYTLRRTRRPMLIKSILAIGSMGVVITFFYFGPITYGTQIATAALESKKWSKSWDWP